MVKTNTSAKKIDDIIRMIEGTTIQTNTFSVIDYVNYMISF